MAEWAAQRAKTVLNPNTLFIHKDSHTVLERHTFPLSHSSMPIYASPGGRGVQKEA